MTKQEILEYCKTRCKHRGCQGKYLKKATKTTTFAGFIIAQKGAYHCTKVK